jgi:hypothetical protein
MVWQPTNHRCVQSVSAPPTDPTAAAAGTDAFSQLTIILILLI